MNRHSFLRLMGLAALAPLATAVSAQSWPARPIRFIVPFPPGGSSDVFVRSLTPKMSEVLGQPVVVDYKTGAAGSIGLDAVAKAAPDGYTIGLASPGGLVAVPHLVKVPYSVEKDFAFITRLARVPSVIATGPGSGIRSAPEMIDKAKAAPGALNYGHAGQGTLVHLAGELFKREAHLNITPVPFKGAAPAVQALMGDQIQLIVADLAAVWTQISNGQIRPLVVTSAQRSPVLPNVPSVAELGYPNAVFEAEYGVLAPAGIPQDVLARLSAALLAAIDAQPVREAYLKIGAVAAPLGGREFRKVVLDDYVRWGNFIREQKITAD
jgi:tripartite-type tricarboxylate transporter receptor subunit TctC